MVQPRGEMHQKNTTLFKFISLQQPVQKYEHPRDIFHSENLLQHLFTRQSIYRDRSVQSQRLLRQCFNRSLMDPTKHQTFTIETSPIE